MGLGTSILLIAVGAILKFAVHVQSDNVDVNTVGGILMLVGAGGALLSLAFWSSWGGAGITRRRTTVYNDPAPAVVPGAPVVYDDGTPRRVVQEDVRQNGY